MDGQDGQREARAVRSASSQPYGPAMTFISERPLWVPRPERVEAARITAFAREAERRHGVHLPSFADLHAWSVSDPAAFWDLVWDESEVRGEKGMERAVDLDRMPGARFFPEGRLNFAENLLRRDDRGEALV